MKNTKKIIGLLLLSLLLVSVLSVAQTAGAEREKSPHWPYIGHLNYTTGYAQGRYIEFSIDERTGEIKDYRVNNVTVFEEIEYENETTGMVHVHGSVLTYKGVGIPFTSGRKNHTWGMHWRFICAHDNPAGVLHIITHGSDTLTYKLGENITAAFHNSTVYLNSSAYEFEGRLIVSGADVGILSSENETEIVIKTADNTTGSVIFINTLHLMVPKHIATEVIQGIEKGKIGAQIYISPNNMDFVNYSYQMHVQLQLREKNRIRLTLSSENSEGKGIMIALQNGTLNYGKNYRLNVTLDGKEVSRASYAEVMNATGDARYAVMESDGTLYLMLYVPHFSTHTVEIESDPIGASSDGEEGATSTSSVPLLSTTILIVILVAVIIVGVIAAVLIRSR